MRIIKIFILPVGLLLLMACQENTDAAAVATTEIEAPAHDRTAVQEHEAIQENTLALNHGAKWTVDESTRKHTDRLYQLVSAFHEKATPDFSAYQNFANGLQAELNLLISDCRMKGAEHDMLHHWLEPVLKDVKDLMNTTNSEAAAAVVTTLTTDMRKFNQFFD